MLELTKLSKTYGTQTVLQEVTLNFAPQSFTCIVGKSGCGKTTLLRLLAGLEQPTSGKITLASAITVGTVFQEPRLMPWLTVTENIAFAAKARPELSLNSLPELLEALELTAAAKLYPTELSGGMAQRVSLGRTLFANPDLILMDEPFSALDYFTRRSLQQMLLKLYLTHKKTIIFVTHDVEEAILLADRVLIMDKGTIESTIAIDLPQPRTAGDPAFQSLRQQILQALL